MEKCINCKCQITSVFNEYPTDGYICDDCKESNNCINYDGDIMVNDCETCKNNNESEWSKVPCFACDGVINSFYENIKKVKDD